MHGLEGKIKLLQEPLRTSVRVVQLFDRDGAVIEMLDSAFCVSRLIILKEKAGGYWKSNGFFSHRPL